MGKPGNESLKRLERLGDVCTIQSGGTPSRSKKEFWDGGTVPWVKISDFDGIYLDSTEEKITEKGLAQSSAKLFTKGTILYSIFATLGEVCILDIDAATNQAIAGITIKDEDIDQKYLYYFLCSIKPKIMKIGRGVAQNNINLSILRSLEIPIPSLEEQKKVAGVLDAATALAAKRRRQLALLDTLTQSRFVEMFGDPNDRRSLFKNRHKIGELCDVTKLAGFEFTKYIKYQKSGDIIMLRGLNCKSGKLVLDDVKYIDRETSYKLPRSRLYAGDILMTYAGTIGDVAMVDEDDKYHLAPNVAKITITDKNKLNPVFLIHLFMYSHDYIMTFASQVAQASINMQKIREFEYEIPCIDKQNEFAEFVSEVDRQKAALRRSLTALTTLKSALMQEYFGN